MLALSLGASGVSALISFVGSLTKPGGLKDQAATLNGSYAPGRPWLDLAWQLFGIATALVPVALVAHLLMREGAGLRTLGFDRTRPGRTWAGAPWSRRASAAPGWRSTWWRAAAGFNLTVVPESLPDVWWKFPVLILSAVQNSVVEEVIVVGYLLRRLGQLGWTPMAALVASSVLRGSYHLYQGDRRLHRQHGHGRRLRAAVPALGAGRAAGRRARAARHRGVRRIRAARGEGGLAAHPLSGRAVAGTRTSASEPGEQFPVDAP